MNINAAATLQINTSSLDYTTLHGDVIAADTLFDLELRGALKILAFNVDFRGRMSVIDEVFKLDAVSACSSGLRATTPGWFITCV
jgi:hypothetical protein